MNNCLKIKEDDLLHNFIWATLGFWNLAAFYYEVNGDNCLYFEANIITDTETQLSKIKKLVEDINNDETISKKIKEKDIEYSLAISVTQDKILSIEINNMKLKDFNYVVFSILFTYTNLLHKKDIKREILKQDELIIGIQELHNIILERLNS